MANLFSFTVFLYFPSLVHYLVLVDTTNLRFWALAFPGDEVKEKIMGFPLEVKTGSYFALNTKHEEDTTSL